MKPACVAVTGGVETRLTPELMLKLIITIHMGIAVYLGSLLAIFRLIDKAGPRN